MSGVVRDAYGQDTVAEPDAQRIVAALEAAGTPAYVDGEAAGLVASADAMLADFELSPAARQSLREIGRYLVERDR